MQAELLDIRNHMTQYAPFDELPDELLDRKMRVRGINPVKYPEISPDMLAYTKIRHGKNSFPSILHPTEGNKVDVVFQEPVTAIAPGQSAVFYEGDDVLGGGWIETVGQ